MKKISPIFLLVSVIFTAATATGTQPDMDHIPRDGDRLHPGIANARSLILSVNDSMRTVLVDPLAVSFDDDCDASAYIDTDTISYVQFTTKHRFLLRGDTLSYMGYENRASDFRLDSAATVAFFPLKDGDTVRSDWTGHLFQYGTMMLKHVSGISRGEAQGGWTVTDGTDTISNTVRLRWTLDMAYADPDSVTTSMPDSIASGIISDMQVDVRTMLSERLLTERTMWFSQDARYPVLTDSRVSRVIFSDGVVPVDTVPLSMLAMHYPASYQHSDTGEDYIAQKPDGKHSGDTYGESGYVSQDTGNSLSVGEPEAEGRVITVTLSSPSGSVVASVTLFSDSGVVLTEPQTVTVGTVPQIHSFEAPSGWSGVMLLRVDAGDESHTRKIIR